MDLAKEISPSQAPDYVIARINGNQLWDMNRPLESDCSSIEFFTFDSELGREVFWHSSSHVLGYALEMKYGDSAYLCDGPPLMQQGGFFYDIFVERRAEETSADSSSSSKLLSVPITEEEYAEIEKYASEVAKRKDRFERMQVSRELALKMFENNRFKREIIEGIPADESITVYRCGSFIDLCRGPHLPHTGKVKAFQLLKSSACYFKGDTERESLQRVYGISFPDAKLLAEWHHQREEAAKRDHRVLGKQQELFMFHEMSPGSAFFYPHGARIFTRLVDFMRREYRRRGYEEVMTPLIFNKDLWVTSGHWQNYKENMYLIQEGDDHLHHHHHHHDHGHDHPDDHHQHEVLMGLKPMNCPGHCLMFASKARSYRELPVRWADFSPLHRAEAAGALSGLTRVRRFHQDDSHIFCTEEQVAAEILGCLDFVHYVYHKIFGFEIQYRLSTRPDKYLGSIELWNAAEEALKQSLEKIVGPGKYELNEGDGAFYGPKIDVVVTDAIQRKHQCATIQLDFQMPRRFRLKYQGEDGSQEHTPVIIHRAILGSVERFMAMLAEHTAGKWPFWLSPRQCVVCPVSERFLGYAEEVRHTIEAAFEDRQAHVRVDVDTSDKTLSKKIRDAQLAQYNYILVVGEKELEAREVNVRSTREDNVVRGSMSVEQLIAEFRDLIANYK